MEQAVRCLGSAVWAVCAKTLMSVCLSYIQLPWQLNFPDWNHLIFGKMVVMWDRRADAFWLAAGTSRPRSKPEPPCQISSHLTCFQRAAPFRGPDASPDLQQSLTNQPGQESRLVWAGEGIHWCFCPWAPLKRPHWVRSRGKDQCLGRFVLSVAAVIYRSWWAEPVSLRDQEGADWLRGILHNQAK